MTTGTLEIVRFRDILPVLKVTRFVPGTNTLTLEIKGEDFTSVERVLINDTPVSEFMIVNRGTMWVTLPSTAQLQVRSIQVLSSGFTMSSEASSLIFEIGNKTKAVNGLIRLLQLFTKWLLQSPGSDLFNPERGGGLQEIVGSLSASKEMQPALAAIMQSVSATVTQIKRVQNGLPGLSLDERLMSASVQNMSVSSDQLEVSAYIELSAVSGRKAISTIAL
jgi:hypothetical protein